VGAVHPRPQPCHESASSSHGGSTLARVCLKALLCTAEASTTEGTAGGKPARPGLYGGCRVTGIPTVEAPEARKKKPGKPGEDKVYNSAIVQ